MQLWVDVRGSTSLHMNQTEYAVCIFTVGVCMCVRNCLSQLVIVWDASHAAKDGEVPVMAKAHTDVDITRLHVADFDDTR